MKKIADIFKSAPKSIIKFDNYFEIYDRIFSKFINKKITLVEVGIGFGGSLFMWKSFFGEDSRIIGIDLNPEAKKLEEHGFEIFIGDQSDPKFWENFYNHVGKIDILIDDGGHRNLQQISSLVESINYINDNGLIIIEDTHTSFMRKKGFKNPSKYSFINYCVRLIENIHRRNPLVEKENNFFSKKIYSIEFFNSLTVINIDSKRCQNSSSIKNDLDIKNWFTDYRHEGYYIKSKKFFNRISNNSLFNRVIRKIFHRNLFFSMHEKYRIKKYINKTKE